MNIAARLVDRINDKGFLDTAEAIRRRVTIAASKMLDRQFDPSYGTETNTVVEVANMDIDADAKVRAVRYEPTRARPFLERV